MDSRVFRQDFYYRRGVRAAACVLACLLVALLWACLDPGQEADRQWIARGLLVPVVVAALCFGLRGGLGLATACSLALVVLYGQDTGWSQLMDLGLLLSLGWLAGWLMERHRLMGAKQRANQRLTDLGRAAASVSHELRNPLGIIGGYAEVLALDGQLNSRQVQSVQIILGQVERMRSLLAEVREYAMPMEIKPLRLNLHEVVQEVMELMGPAAREARVRLVDEPWPPAPWVEADPGRLQQLMCNLVHNALQASRPGGQVWLATRGGEQAAVLEIIDQGDGLTRSEVAQIFTPFYTTKKNGTGLGLPICQRIAQAHGGDLELSGAPGKGAKARLTLPLAIAPG